MKRLVLFLLVAIVLSPGRASAQDDLRVAEAKRRMVEGKKLHAEGKFESAWLKFVEACAVIHTDKCLLGLAITEHAAGKEVDAYNHLRGLLEPTPKPAIEASAVQGLTKAMGEAYAHTGHLHIVAPEHYAVVIDREEVGHAPLADTITVKIGTHTIEAKEGAQTLTASVEALAGQVEDVTLAVPVSAPPAITAAPILIVPPSNSVTNDAPVEHRSWVASPAVPIVLGVAVVGLAVGGTVMHFNANSADSEASSLRNRPNASGSACVTPGTAQSTCDRLSSLSGTSSTDRALEAGMFIGAGVATVGVLAWLFWHREDNVSSAIVPLVSPHLAGAALTSTF